ncbi:GrpE protein, mitochondrial [Chamberlinius hualienensis]
MSLTNTWIRSHQILRCLQLLKYRPLTVRLSGDYSTAAANENEKPHETPENKSNSSESDKTLDISPELAECLKAKETLTEKVAEFTDKYKRALAETENVRQRMQRQIDDAKLFGIQGFCKDLLEVADILQKATTSIPSDKLNDSPYLKSLFEGVEMTDTQLQKVFKKHGLVQIDPIGEKFNPNFHEALFEQPIPGKEPGTVAVVTKIGYKLHERTIRPALVGVVKKL